MVGQVEMDLSIPDDVLPTGDITIMGTLKTQGGGHGKIQKSVFGGTSIRCIAKPYIPREDNFYKQLLPTPLAQHTCMYMGVHLSQGQRWLLLEDQTSDMASPCVLDIKLGTRSFEVSAPPEKVRHQLEHIRDTTTASHAVRIIDARIRSRGRTEYVCDRVQGHALSIGGFEGVLRQFLPGRRRNEFLQSILRIRAALLETREMFPNMRLYSASILAVYDGDSEAPMKVTVIDFAHAYIDVEAEGGCASDPAFDDNATKGLQSLIDMLIPCGSGEI